MSETLLKIKDLTIEYTSDDQTIQAVNHIDLAIKQGETLGLVGETGAGKTTVAKAILKILPDPPAKYISGEILFEGNDILRMDNSSLRKVRGKRISMIFQDPMTALNPTVRIGDQIADVIHLHNKISRRQAKQQAGEMLETVGISKDRYREYPHQFSGGMKQRVVIAMALACSPDLILADEPTTALDVTIQAQVLSMIKVLKKEKDTSMLLITHDLGIVAGNCDKVAVMYAGEIVEFGTLEEVFDYPSHPYTVGLFEALPDLDKDVEWLSPISGMPPDPSCLPVGCKFAERCPYVCEACKEAPIDVQELGGTHQCRCINPMNKRGEAG